MKVLSIAIPSYNSEAYMANCIESLLVGGEDVEILVVNDGSKDGTARIADEYAAKYPNIVRAVHQENGGHGEAVNAGLRNATGAYFKVVDSDDWVDTKAYKEILALLKQMLTDNVQLDMLISNFVYDKQGASFKKVMNYRSVLPQNQIFTWDQIGHFKKGQYILMHSVIYRTQMLRDCKLELPKHTFYVDNIFVYQPLPAVKTIYYLDVDFYHYFIGRNDQSVNEKVMIKRIDQQLRVNKLMIDYYDLSDKNMVPNKKLRQYMYNYLEIMMVISSIMLILSHEEENLKKREELWEYLQLSNPRMYKKLRYDLFGRVMTAKTPVGRKFAELCYKISQKIYGFN
ncbi:MAG: glycosyltransferase family 2 protein [Peptococcaceae bacterium]|nr:glycosyltransferase family 2 protein [Peptococcaceae bacterium]